MTPYDAPGHASCLMRCQFFAFCNGARLDAPDGCRALVMAGRPLMAVGDINHQRGYAVILHIYKYLCIQLCIICIYRTILYYNMCIYIILYLFYILCKQYVLPILQIFILCIISNILSIKYLHNHAAHIWLFASRSYVLVEFVRRMFDAWNWLDTCLGVVIVRFWLLFWGAKQLMETAPNENWFVWNQQKTDILFKHNFFPMLPIYKRESTQFWFIPKSYHRPEQMPSRTKALSVVLPLELPGLGTHTNWAPR